RGGSGDRHCPLRKLVLYHLLKTQGFYKAEKSSILIEAEKPINNQGGDSACPPDCPGAEG
ncbi:MAG TPA: hypothetical protein VJ350_06460, partial [Methanoregula sp.]|nr:hypothetical protein [Methanoregula sp.]